MGEGSSERRIGRDGGSNAPASTEEDLLLQWDAFKCTFPADTTINNFLEKNWINKERMPEWAPLYRLNYQHLDTNNLVERWNRNLKHNYLDGRRNLRADDLVYILLGVVDNQFCTHYYKVVSSLQPHQLTTYEKKRCERAARVAMEQARTMINIAQSARGVISVQSFETPAVVQYLVEVLADNWLRCCSCPDNQQQQIACKHMFLVSRVHPQFQVRYFNKITDLVETVDEETVNEEDFGPPMEEFLSPNLVEQLRVAREEEEQRLQAIQREEEQEKKETAGGGKGLGDERVRGIISKVVDGQWQGSEVHRNLLRVTALLEQAVRE